MGIKHLCNEFLLIKLIRMPNVLVDAPLSGAIHQAKGEFHKEIRTERHTKMPPGSTFLDTALLPRKRRGFETLLVFR